MQKRLTGIIAMGIIAAAFTFTSCKKDNEAIAPKQQITAKWTMESATGIYSYMGQSYKDTTYFTAADYVQFNADGTLAIKEDGEDYTGKWTLDSTNTKLVITESDYLDYNGGFDITKISGSQLQLHYKQTTAGASTEQTLNLKK
jgi:hypothetical protein